MSYETECKKCHAKVIVTEHPMGVPGGQDKEQGYCPACGELVAEFMSDGFIRTALAPSKMRELKYTICRDRHGHPLVMLNSPLGNGQEIVPDSLRRLAAALVVIAGEAEAKDMGNGYMPASKSTEF
ncbi:hypothetical protein [Crenobacter cavernae]|uniref:Uncharacterized protein n=1 Tax=Crenobacter cavernae TaxID=2290923 RepID=A0A345Y3M0_9NEIS|nr:hypothetical protein [Crenobacter cavernae]AXK38522.1 hypothetical protein DWG20_03265 [Crenobacter cavernae]